MVCVNELVISLTNLETLSLKGQRKITSVKLDCVVYHDKLYHLILNHHKDVGDFLYAKLQNRSKNLSHAENICALHKNQH